MGYNVVERNQTWGDERWGEGVIKGRGGWGPCYFDTPNDHLFHCPPPSGWLGMWRIPNPYPNPTESGTFSEILNPTDT